MQPVHPLSHGIADELLRALREPLELIHQERPEVEQVRILHCCGWDEKPWMLFARDRFGEQRCSAEAALSFEARVETRHAYEVEAILRRGVESDYYFSRTKSGWVFLGHEDPRC